jgi:hypothetical protein
VNCNGKKVPKRKTILLPEDSIEYRALLTTTLITFPEPLQSVPLPSSATDDTFFQQNFDLIDVRSLGTQQV